MSNSTQNKDTTVKVDYAFIPLDNTECPICGIRTFEHLHQEGTKPKDFIRVSDRLPDASKTKDRALQEDWNERFDRNCDRDSKINEKDPTALIGFPGKNSPIYKGVKDFFRKERADARKEVIQDIESLKIQGEIGGEGVMKILQVGSKELFHDSQIFNNAIDKVLSTLKEEQI